MTDGEAREYAARAYRSWLTDAAWAAWFRSNELDDRRAWILANLHTLRGKSLCCWCPEPADGQEDHCHAAVLIHLVGAEGTASGTREAANVPGDTQIVPFPQVEAS